MYRVFLHYPTFVILGGKTTHVASLMGDKVSFKKKKGFSD